MIKRILGGVLALLLLAAPAGAATYYMSSVSVNSTTTPVVALPPSTAAASFVLCLRSTATVAVLCWPYYSNTAPVSVPANAWEITASSCRGDTASVAKDPTMGAGWACAQSTSGAAVTLDVLAR